MNVVILKVNTLINRMANTNYMSNSLKYLILLLLSLILFSCAENKGTRYLIGVSQCSNDEWRDKLNKEIALEAMFRGNVDIVFKAANDNSEKQAQDIADLVKSKVDLLIIAPNESSLTPAVEAAYSKGIPIIISDRKIRSESYTAYVGPDNYEIGVLAGENVVKELHGRGNIVELKGTEGASVSIERHEGFMSVIRKYPRIHIVYSESAVFLEDIGEKKMKEALAMNPSIDLVYAHNDRMAKGAYRAIKEAGREKEMILVGIDALSEDGFGVDMILSGELKTTFINATGGDIIMDLAMDILEGRPYERVTTLPTTQVDMSNARVLKSQTKYINDQGNKIITLNQAIDRASRVLHRQRLLLVLFIIIVATLCVLLLLNNRLFRKNRTLNRELLAKNEEIVEKNVTLSDQMQQIEAATQAKLNFYMSVSHDFLTPLTLINEPLDEVLRGKLDDHQRNLLDMAKRNTGILTQLVRQILDFRHFDDNSLRLNISPGNLSVKARQWTRSFLPSMVKKGIAFHFEKSGKDSDYEMNLDYNKIERAVYNLLFNALKYTEEGGSITVRMKTEGVDTERRVVLEISDTGIGMDADCQNKLFERFFKADPYSSGAGIGLSIVKSFVELHNGSVEVESELGKGSTFRICLPFLPMNNIKTRKGDVLLSDSIMHIDQVNRTFSFSSSSKPTILVVEDNQDMLNYLKTLLEDKYSVILAQDGRMGLKYASRYLPNLIITDIVMPELDGFEFCRRLKSEPLTRVIPIIMLSALTLETCKKKGIEIGADLYIEKPFDSSLFLAYVKNLMESGKLRRPLSSGSPSPDLNETKSVPEGDALLQKVYKIMDAHISDSSYNMSELGVEVGLSRAQLFRKIKEITGTTPNMLLRSFRMERARKKLLSNNNVSEVAYDCGFSSPAYFAKCFKEKYQESPTSFQKRMAVKNDKN